jgi:hypothetical protein
MKTIKEIVSETIEYIKSTPKAYDTEKGQCLYTKIIDGKKCHCAVGRCLLEDFQQEDWEHNGFGIQSFTKENPEMPLDSILKEEYRGHGRYFWEDLQDLHDDVDNLYFEENEQGGRDLTKKGHIYAESINLEYS